MSDDPTLKAEAFRMLAGGASGREVAEHFGVPLREAADWAAEAREAQARSAAAQQAAILRTSSGLREALFDELDALRAGRSDPRRAAAVAGLAKQIVESVKLEIVFAEHSRRAAAGEPIALAAPLRLGGG